MTTYYAYSNENWGLRYRLKVRGNISPFTGEFSHKVMVEQKVNDEPYEYIGERTVFCCYNGKEAARYIAGQLKATIA